MESYSHQLIRWRRILLAWKVQRNLGVQGSVVHPFTCPSSSSQGSFLPCQGFDFCIKGLPALCLQFTLQFCDPYNDPLSWFFRSLPSGCRKWRSPRRRSSFHSHVPNWWLDDINLSFFSLNSSGQWAKATHLFNSYDHYTPISFRHSTVA